MNILKSIKALTKFEAILWLISVIVVTLSYLPSGDGNAISLIASLCGVTALIFLAKGDALGQLLTIVFSLLYGIVSFETAYYGEMITYLCMTMPMAVVSMIEWLRHPYEKGKNEVEISQLTKKQIVKTAVYSVVVTVILYFVLKYFNTANLWVSTISVTTSFAAVYLTFCRSEYYALAYGANDIVLIILWVMASVHDLSYLPMVACFGMFLINDIYGFINWQRMKKRQEKGL